MICFRISVCAGKSNTKQFLNTKTSPRPQFCLYCSFESLFCCNKLWLVTLNGPEPKSAVQLSEAVVGGRVPRRLAQQTVCGVFG